MTRQRWLPLLLLPLCGLIAAAGILLLGGRDADPPPTSKAARHPIPAPVTFIPPTPLPVTPRPALPPAAEEVMDEPLPELVLTTLDGATLDLRDLRGQIVFLNFWATWCLPCRDEMPALQFLQDYEAEHVRVVGITDPTAGQTEDDIRQFLDALNITFTVALSDDPAVYQAFGAAVLPMTYIADDAGVLRYRHVGELTLDDIGAYLAALEGEPD